MGMLQAELKENLGRIARSGEAELGGAEPLFRESATSKTRCRCTTHFRTYFGGDWDVHWWLTGILTHGQIGEDEDVRLRL